MSRFSVFFFACLLAACGQKKTTPAADSGASKPGVPAAPTLSAPASPSPVPSGEAGDGAAPRALEELGLGAAIVHVPKGLAPGEKAPLVVVLHGYGASSEAIDRYSDFRNFAEAKHIAWIAPDGQKDRKGKQFWNAGASCCNFDHSPVDHVAALRKLVERAVATHPIDPKRVYFVGYSNGGFMAHRVACELGGTVRGVVSVSGAGRQPDEACLAKAPVRVLQVHGDMDPVVDMDGGALFGDPQYPTHLSAKQTVRDWAKRFGCKPKPVAGKAFDFEARLPDAETKVERFEGCRAGAAVELWTVEAGNHFVGFRSPSQEAIWKFLSGS